MDILISMEIASPKSLYVLEEQIKSCKANRLELINRENVLRHTMRRTTETQKYLDRLGNDIDNSIYLTMYLQLQVWLKQTFVKLEEKFTHKVEPGDGLEFTHISMKYNRAKLLNEQQTVITKFHEIMKRYECFKVKPVKKIVEQMQKEKLKIEGQLKDLMMYYSSMLKPHQAKGKLVWPIEYDTDYSKMMDQ